MTWLRLPGTEDGEDCAITPHERGAGGQVVRRRCGTDSSSSPP